VILTGAAETRSGVGCWDGLGSERGCWWWGGRGECDFGSLAVKTPPSIFSLIEE